MRRQLVEVGAQFGVELPCDVVAEQVAERPAGDDDGRRDPHQRAGDQANAQRAAPAHHVGPPGAAKR
ncbi:MAG: hypothetical protein AW08_01830 [Candidatus Accumulibacter adjunctus]|uniref:Uncharacterized protein n=1 Tax=Candidatus Accumulibacter adjunctus TaxID=1454001 RepID=A0A011PML7_9PROT|nr:MAG: hypothetical protein AW08_01830 [Candidatus Accumulibacter adjunctus]